MRKSDKVILTAVFLSAITTARAWAQASAPDAAKDTTNNSAGHGSRHHGWLHGGLFHWGKKNSAPATGQASRPRTGGFGNTLRTMFSGHS